MRLANSLVWVGCGLVSVLAGAAELAAQAPSAARPNILWLTTEDMGPHLGCYGDSYATTPHIDRFARQSLRYTTAWSVCPVCAPARTALITGMYPWALGAEHMRSMVKLPSEFKLYPQYLREAGYYCTNNSKEDYNVVKPGEVWDESSNKAHWQNRGNKPFFAVFNFTTTHESQIRTRPHRVVHDPAKAPVPPYHPDTPEVRLDWAQYYDNITTMDAEFARRLAELDAAGLADDTIVFFYGDHGSGMPGHKRVARNTGLHVPLLVRIPPKFRHLAPSDYQPGGTTGRLVSFVDFGPTALHLAGVALPPQMQGRPYLGTNLGEAPALLFGGRGRMDERHDLVRTARDSRYVYVRNFAPHLPWGQHVDYMFQTPTTKIWRNLFVEKKLTPEQAAFWLPKGPEELYDLESDPHETKNLAQSEAHREVLERMRRAVHEHQLAVRDIDLLPEPEMLARGGDSSPHEACRDDAKYPLAAVLETAEQATSLKPEHNPALVAALAHTEAGVRYWGARGFLLRGEADVQANSRALERMLTDDSISVRIAAAEALARYGKEYALEKGKAALVNLCWLETNPWPTAVLALNAIDNVGPNMRSVLAPILLAPKTTRKIEGRFNSYVPRITESIDAKLNPKPRLNIPPIAK